MKLSDSLSIKSFRGRIKVKATFSCFCDSHVYPSRTKRKVLLEMEIESFLVSYFEKDS